MSYHVFFDFSEGLAQTLKVPPGTKRQLIAHVEEVEETLGLKRDQYKGGKVYWDHWDPAYRAGFPDVDDKTLCETVEEHNEWVRYTYERFATWSETPVEDGEDLTPDDAAEFWHGFRRLDVSIDRWTGDYYRSRMEHLYDVMRDRNREGVSFDEDALTPAQASAVIRIFSEYLDPEDLRLEVMKDCDHLSSTDEYDWCEKCGAVDPYASCENKDCPVREDDDESE